MSDNGSHSDPDDDPRRDGGNYMLTTSARVRGLMGYGIEIEAGEWVVGGEGARRARTLQEMVVSQVLESGIGKEEVVGMAQHPVLAQYAAAMGTGRFSDLPPTAREDAALWQAAVPGPAPFPEYVYDRREEYGTCLDVGEERWLRRIRRDFAEPLQQHLNAVFSTPAVEAAQARQRAEEARIRALVREFREDGEGEAESAKGGVRVELVVEAPWRGVDPRMARYRAFVFVEGMVREYDFKWDLEDAMRIAVEGRERRHQGFDDKWESLGYEVVDVAPPPRVEPLLTWRLTQAVLELGLPVVGDELPPRWHCVSHRTWDCSNT